MSSVKHEEIDIVFKMTYRALKQPQKGAILRSYLMLHALCSMLNITYAEAPHPELTSLQPSVLIRERGVSP